MKPEKLRRKIVAKYNFLYSLDPFVSLESNLLTMDGMNRKGCYYLAARLSNGQIIREVHEDFEHFGFPAIKLEEHENYREKWGTLTEFLEQGESPKRLFFSMQNWLHCLPKGNRHERDFA